MSIAASRKRYIVYDADFQANVLDVASTSGYTLPSFNKRVILNKLMKDYKNTGAYQESDSISNYALNNIAHWQFSLIDWKRPGVLHSPLGGITYTQQGWKGNGVDGYIDMNFTASGSSHFTLNNAGIIVTVYDGIAGTITASSSANGNWMIYGNATNQRLNSTGVLNAAASFAGQGMKGFMRDDASNVRLYNKEVELPRTQTSNTGITFSKQFLLRRTTSYGDMCLSNSLVGGSLNAIKYQQVRNAYNEYLQRISLNPIG